MLKPHPEVGMARTIGGWTGLVLCVAVALTGCSDGDEGTSSTNEAPTTKDTAAPVDAAELDVTASDVGGASTDDCTGRPEGAACDDDNSCTSGDHCEAGLCIGENHCVCATDSECLGMLADLCGGEPKCNTNVTPHVCVYEKGTKVVCAGDTSACVTSVCRPDTGKCEPKAVWDGKPCDDDGDPCTLPGACAKGSCEGQDTSQCECTTDADCESANDDDPCNGVLYCSKGVFPYKCALNKQTVVKCAADDDGPCELTACSKANGKCEKNNVADGTSCDDDDKCTQNDACAAGKCAGAINTCSCATNADCKAQDDGNVCNGTMYCDKAKKVCVVNDATKVKCPTVKDTQCIKNTCQKASGTCAMVAVPVGDPCEDGDACTYGEACNGGVCDTSTAQSKCKCEADADCKAHGSGDLCVGKMVCDKAKGECVLNVGAAVKCDVLQNTACRKKRCVPATGKCELADEATGTVCDDTDACTIGEKCDGIGECTGGTKVCVHQGRRLPGHRRRRQVQRGAGLRSRRQGQQVHPEPGLEGRVPPGSHPAVPAERVRPADRQMRQQARQRRRQVHRRQPLHRR